MALMHEHGTSFIFVNWTFPTWVHLFLPDLFDFTKTIIPLTLMGHESVALLAFGLLGYCSLKCQSSPRPSTQAPGKREA